jgi:pimeloyl-CoA dehydrogenase
MQFELDSDAQQLADSLRRLLDTEGSFEKRRQAASSTPGWNPALWRALGELGVTAMSLPEDLGGFGARPVELLPVLRELGRALSLEPFLSCAVLAATALVRAGNPAQRSQWLPRIADASTVVAWAHDEPLAGHAEQWLETRAERTADGWRLRGRKHNVVHGADADMLIVSARTTGAADSAEGIALFGVQAGQPGVRKKPIRLIDDTPAAQVDFDAAEAELLDGSEAGASGHDVLVTVQQAGLAATCAEALGVAQRAYDLTVDYVRTRHQFGRAIGTNQAVRHRIAEMHVAMQMLRSAAMAALLALDIDDAEQRRIELMRARMTVSRHGIFVCQQGIQLHGGIGMTEEYAVGHCLRRLTVLDQLFGDGPTHAARLGKLLAQDAVRRFVATDEARAAALP